MAALAAVEKALEIKEMPRDAYDDLGEQVIDVDRRLSVHEAVCTRDREERARNMSELKNMYVAVSRDQAALQAALQSNQIAMNAAITANQVATQATMSQNQAATDTRLAAIELRLAAGTGAGRATREIVAYVFAFASFLAALAAVAGHIHFS